MTVARSSGVAALKEQTSYRPCRAHQIMQSRGPVISEEFTGDTPPSTQHGGFNDPLARISSLCAIATARSWFPPLAKRSTFAPLPSFSTKTTLPSPPLSFVHRATQHTILCSLLVSLRTPNILLYIGVIAYLRYVIYFGHRDELFDFFLLFSIRWCNIYAVKNYWSLIIQK